MYESIAFILHLFGFGLLTTALIGGLLLEFRFRGEQEITQKIFILSLEKRFWLLFPFVCLLMLATGTGIMYNSFGPSFTAVPGWLSAKIIFFAILLVNGAFLGPLLIRKRTKFLHTVEEGIFSEKIGPTIKTFNRNILSYYAVQILLLLIILFLSVFGTGKHPGALS
jgi:hypothetical protein